MQRGVKLRDTFWIKSQPYSLGDMFSSRERELARRFEGGSVYLAFLSAFNYHRWHAPVSGVISRAYAVDGSYYSDADSQGGDPSGLYDSQGYITAVAARAVIVIECDDPAVGQVACVFVGMADVSSCIIEALPGQRVRKGDENPPKRAAAYGHVRVDAPQVPLSHRGRGAEQPQGITVA